MVKRKKLAFSYSYEEDWVAGAYYIQNIVQSLCTLEDDLKPDIAIICDNEKMFSDLQGKTAYPYLTWFDPKPRLSLFERICNRIYRNLSGANYFEKRPKGKLFDMVYDVVGNLYYTQLLENKVHWIPDFQEDYYPNFFSKEMIRRRKISQEYMAKNQSKIVFSSENAKEDFLRLYPEHNSKLYIVKFAVSHPPLNDGNFPNIQKKYSLPASYFLCSNQFWRHKNHMVILSALNLLKEQNESDFVVVFTGKPHDPRAPKYYEELQNYVNENGLSDQAQFLDFIPRDEQLLIMKNAHAVIQPSLFEGWGTTVEDAKSLNKFVLASDIPVHQEQLEKNFQLFPPNDAHFLASLLTKKYRCELKSNYKTNIESAANNFLKILSDHD